VINLLKSRQLASFALWALGSAFAAQTANAITIVHSNDLLGELEPCGCRTNPLGGMARKANLLKQTEDKEIIQLDAGDLLFPTDQIPEALKKQSLLQAKYLLKAMDQTHHDAAVPGEKDFALGLSTFQSLAKGTHVKFIAANLKAKSGKKLFEPHLLLKRKDKDGKTVTVAVIGLVGEKLVWPKDLKASPAIATAKSEVTALKSKADYIVALTHQGLDQDEALAKAVPGIDLIIGAHSQSFLQAPPTVGKTLIVQSSFRNQYVGLVPLSHPVKGEDYKLVGLDPRFDSPAQAPSAMDDLVKEFKTAIAELNTREEAEESARLVSSTSSSSIKFHTFPRCAECHLKQFDFWRKTPHARALEPLIAAKQAQNKDCLSCHTVGLGDPKGYEFVTRLAETRHGDETTAMPVDELHAYLKQMNDAKSLDSSVQVSAKGPSEPLRQSLNTISRSFAPVQCENCHQPGQEHPFAGTYSKQVDTTQTCLKCHTPERAPEWYKGNEPDWKIIEAKRAKMTCPAGELTAE
jgi:nitrate/TMAO reductase-like tetraheme cytochrome c subunit